MADGAKPDVPTTDRQNEKKKKHRPFYEAVDAHARRRLKKHRPFYEAVDAHARRRLTRNFQKFSSDDGNESLQSLSPSLTGFNIQSSLTNIVTPESRESPQ